MITPLVIVSRNVAAGNGPQIIAVPTATSNAIAVVTYCATPGTFSRFVLAIFEGRTPALDIANSVRVVVMFAAFAHAVTEFTMARKMMIHAPPHTSRANWSHGAPLPYEAKLNIFAGPKYTVEAYVASMK